MLVLYPRSTVKKGIWESGRKQQKELAVRSFWEYVRRIVKVPSFQPHKVNKGRRENGKNERQAMSEGGNNREGKVHRRKEGKRNQTAATQY